MPLISVTTSAPSPGAAIQETFLSELSNAVAAGLGKSEDYVMTALQAGVPMTFAGTAAPACLVDLRSIGTLTPDQTTALSGAICGLITKWLAVPGARTYIGFTDVERHLWGWDARTFAS